MRILVDLSSSQPQGKMKVNGGGESAIIFFKAIHTHLQQSDTVEVVFNSELPNNDDLIVWCENNNVVVHKYTDLSHLSVIIREGGFNTVVFPVCYHSYCVLDIPDTVRVVSVIHDLCDVYYYSMPMVKYGRYPKLGRFEWMYKLYVRLVSKNRTNRYIDSHNRILKMSKNQIIITVTHFSKSSIIHYLDTELIERIEIVYTPDVHPNNDLSAVFEDAVLDTYGLNRNKYFLFLAGCRWAKNNAIALFALDHMFSNHKFDDKLDGYKAIVLGTDDSFKRYYLKHIKNKNRFEFDDYIDSDALAALYKNAHLFVFPSVLEGFGLPPIEAMKYGTLSACSTAMSIPEVCGDAVLYFDPYNKNSIEMAILRSFDSEYCSIIKENANQRYDKLHAKRTDDLDKFVKLVFNRQN